MPAILALGRPRQEDLEFQASLDEKEGRKGGGRETRREEIKKSRSGGGSGRGGELSHDQWLLIFKELFSF
jgi:hypothetical protein